MENKTRSGMPESSVSANKKWVTTSIETEEGHYLLQNAI